MPKATVNISKCVQNLQEFGGAPDKSVMRSRVFFSLTVGDKTYEGLYVDISQPYGTDYNTDLLEVGRPVGYDGPFAHRAFSEEIEAYYRRLVGPAGAAISIGGGANGVMTDNTLAIPHKFDLEIDNGTAAGW
ncbi:hypothetical protein RBI94_08565 [Pseudomonas putida]|uniref:hypothetical protein n=1 Tax=Pseudomonas putida TaxID=303 RepID=UPI000B0AB28B|nr:hypothetical protein [Pseudomonas putida]MDQ2484063.1 hypothetical protein [Pseudomonas putida]